MRYEDIHHLAETIGRVVDSDRGIRQALFDEFHEYPLPHCVILGSMFCGTSSIYQNLLQHPNVFSNILSHFNETRAAQHRLDPARSDAIVYFVLYFAALQQLKLIDVQNPELRKFLPEVYRSYQLVRSSREELRDLLEPRSSTLITAMDGNFYLTDTPSRFQYSTRRMKAVVIFRDPVERAYSDFRSKIINKVKGYEGSTRFEDHVNVESLANYLTTGDEQLLDLGGSFELFLGRGMYARWVREWLRVIPMENFFFIHNVELTERPAEVANALYAFLGLPQIEITPYGTFGSVEDTHRDQAKQFAPFSERTETILREFFAPLNADFLSLISSAAGVYDPQRFMGPGPTSGF